MSIWSRLNKEREKIINQTKQKYESIKAERAEEKQLYKETYREAKRDAIRYKAQVKAEKIKTNARRDAQEGGKVFRVAKDGVKALRKIKADKIKNSSNKGNRSPRIANSMFRK